MKCKVFKMLFSLIVIFLTSMVAYADSVPIKKGRETIGKVSYSYEIQPTYKGGAFVHITASNSTKEDVSVTFTTDKGGSTTIKLRGYETTTETIGVNEVPSVVYSVTDYVVAN